MARVLVIDDDALIAAMIARGLNAKGHDAQTVSCGADALARLDADDIDVQLLDLGLPDMDGLDVLRQLRDRGSTIPVIVITARSDPTDHDTAIRLGAVEYLTKPFAWPRLWAAIERCVANPT